MLQVPDDLGERVAIEAGAAKGVDDPLETQMERNRRHVDGFTLDDIVRRREDS